MGWDLAQANGAESAANNKMIVARVMTTAQILEAQMLSKGCLENEYKNCVYY